MSQYGLGCLDIECCKGFTLSVPDRPLHSSALVTTVLTAPTCMRAHNLYISSQVAMNVDLLLLSTVLLRVSAASTALLSLHMTDIDGT